MDGLAAIERLRTEAPQIAIVVLTTCHDDDMMPRSLYTRARGHLLKDTDRDTLFNTIGAVARGKRSKEIAARLGLAKCALTVHSVSI